MDLCHAFDRGLFYLHGSGFLAFNLSPPQMGLGSLLLCSYRGAATPRMALDLHRVQPGQRVIYGDSARRLGPIRPLPDNAQSGHRTPDSVFKRSGGDASRSRARVCWEPGGRHVSPDPVWLLGTHSYSRIFDFYCYEKARVRLSFHHRPSQRSALDRLHHHRKA